MRISEWQQWLERLREGNDALVLMQELVNTARRKSRAQTALLLLPDPSGRYVDFAVVAGRGADDLMGLRLRVEEIMLEETLLHHKDWSYYDASQNEDNYFGVRKGMAGLRSALAIPLPGLKGAALALVNHKEDAPFDPKTLIRLRAYAEYLPWLLHIRELQHRAKQNDLERQRLETMPQHIGNELSLQAVIRNAITLLREVEAFAGAIWLFNEERSRLFCAQHYGLDTPPAELNVEQYPLPWENGAARIDASEWNTVFPQAADETLHSLLVAPLRRADKTLGLLIVGSPKSDAYSERDERILTAIASQIGLALSHALLYEQIARRARNATALFELSQQLGAAQNEPEILSYIARAARRLIPCDHVAIYLPEEDHLRAAHAQPFHPDLNEYEPILRHSLPGWAYAFNAPIAAADLPSHAQNQLQPIPGGFQSALAVPLQVGDRALGVLIALSHEPRLFTLSEIELLFTIGNTGALSLSRERGLYEPA
ncbi:MAG: GAF domain-containing protein [Fimbriimonadia bacterium]|nr:GAF domain-containing protein [Fimbriimonadia bacterium]